MIKKKVSLLIVDDHPSMIEGYKSILSYNDLGYEIEVTAAYDCESAYKILSSTKDLYKFDMFFFDLSLPPYEAKKMMSGEDLALYAKKKFPQAKIVILTSHYEAFVLYQLQSKVAPHGLLVKSDFTADELLFAFETILNNSIYRSKTVKQSIKELLSNNKFLDEINRQIITLLASGIQSKNLPNHMKITMSAIDKRKVQIKEILAVPKGTDQDIIMAAKKHGFI
jgi:DNA-binding NarL/FixJ family response regulator